MIEMNINHIDARIMREIMFGQSGDDDVYELDKASAFCAQFGKVINEAKSLKIDDDMQIYCKYLKFIVDTIKEAADEYAPFQLDVWILPKKIEPAENTKICPVSYCQGSSRQITTDEITVNGQRREIKCSETNCHTCKSGAKDRTFWICEEQLAMKSRSLHIYCDQCMSAYYSKYNGHPNGIQPKSIVNVKTYLEKKRLYFIQKKVDGKIIDAADEPKTIRINAITEQKK
eukprot:473829_1